MDAQVKKGSLELCVLLCLQDHDCYGYEISKKIGDLLEVKEGTIYLVLQRLDKTPYLSSYETQTDQGRIRKYYSLTDDGRKRMEELVSDYHALNLILDGLINQKEGNNE